MTKQMQKKASEDDSQNTFEFVYKYIQHTTFQK